MAKKVQQTQGGKSKAVAVGIFGEQGSDLVKQAAAHEFGARINHPGGTRYDFVDGKVRFLKNSAAIVDHQIARGELGRTRPHLIIIPERSFLRSWLRENQAQVKKFVGRQFEMFISGRQDLRTSLQRMGVFAVSGVRRKITTGPFKPLKSATIRRKGSSRPLIDTGRMRLSITFKEIEKGK